MVEVEPSSVENGRSAAPQEAGHDFSVVQGFQVVGADDHGATLAGDQTWRDALRLELEARAARLHQAVDAAIVLSNDGVIRWLGDPVARLALGANVLNPGAVILADESLPSDAQETIKTRIELWIAATTRRVLAPLFALEGLQEGSEIVRDFARELVRSLGVLEREPIKAKVKALSQDDRAELRKQGVRFGAYYIFVPALIKPAPRGLALQLWGLQAAGDASELLRALAPAASSGRTSLPLDKAISKEGYRVAGYRSCGERAVRVDVVERLAGMIRAAIAGELPGLAAGPASHRAGKGFVVSGDMTSLTGCSGESFASILRSLSFRPVEMKRSDFFGSPSANQTTGQLESSKPAEDQGPIADDQASPTAAREEEASADAVLPAPPAVLPPETVLKGADAVIGGPETVADGDDAVPEDVEAVPEDVEAVAEGGGGAVPEGVDSVLEGGADAVADNGDPVPGDTAPSLVAEDSSESALGVDASAQPAPLQTSESSSEAANKADMIVVWRPDHRRISPHRERGRKQSRSAAPGRVDTHDHNPDAAPKPTPRAAAHSTAKPNQPDAAYANEKRRHRPRDYDMARTNPTTAPQQKAKVDPNSPFAKLLELRPLLEGQANKRQ